MAKALSNKLISTIHFSIVIAKAKVEILHKNQTQSHITKHILTSILVDIIQLLTSMRLEKGFINPKK